MSALALPKEHPTRAKDTKRSALWAIAVALALLLHLQLTLWPWSDWFKRFSEAPPPIEIKAIDPKTLSEIKSDWQKEKALLLSKDLREASKTAPKDARYQSDKNRDVEKEMQARDQDVMPSRQRGEIAKPQAQPAAPKTLSQLGVNYAFQAPAPAAPTGAGGQADRTRDQAIREKNLPQGAENALKTEESVYYSFYSRLYETIGPIWQSYIREIPGTRRVLEGEYVTQVEILLDKQGQLVDVVFLRRSGIQEFDDAVLRSWRKVRHFPNPPAGLLKADGLVHTGWTFFVNVGPGFNLDYVPPRRDY